VPGIRSSMLGVRPPALRPYMLLLPLLAVSMLLHLHLAVGLHGADVISGSIGTASTSPGMSTSAAQASVDASPVAASPQGTSTAQAPVTVAPPTGGHGNNDHTESLCGLIVALAGLLFLVRIATQRWLSVADRRSTSRSGLPRYSQPLLSRVLDIQCRLSLVGTIRA
jgi:hypothetical protein